MQTQIQTQSSNFHENETAYSFERIKKIHTTILKLHTFSQYYIFIHPLSVLHVNLEMCVALRQWVRMLHNYKQSITGLRNAKDDDDYADDDADGKIYSTNFY